MKVILKEDVRGIGKKHEIVEVKDGYAKNFLIRKQLAVVDNDLNRRHLEKELERLAAEEEKKLDEALLLKNKLEKMELHFSLNTNHNGAVFGQISNKAIMDAINGDEKLIDKHMLAEHYELTIGPSTIKLNLGKGVVAEVKVFVDAVQEAK